LWWVRDFPGGTDQASEARHWIADLLPDCDLLLTFSCSPANCARTPSCTPVAGSPVGGSASLSSGRPTQPGS
jgi:hypothetical protein